MQPNNPANFITGLPSDSFSGAMPPAPQQPQQPQQPMAPPPFDPQQFSQFAQPTPGYPQPGGDPGYGQFAPDPSQVSSDPLGLGGPQQPQYPQQQPQAPVAPGGLPLYRQPQQQPQQPQPGQQPGQPAPYQPSYAPQAPQVPGTDPNQPPAWAIELAQMIQQNQQQPGSQQPGQQQPGWKPRSWQDVEAHARDIARETAVSIREQEKTAEQQAQAASDARVAQIQQDLEGQLQSMTFNGQMPAVMNGADPNDQGRAYRRELIGLAESLNTTNLYSVNEQLQNLHRAGYRYDPQTKRTVAASGYPYTPSGQQVPIASGGGAPAGGNQLPSIGTLRRASVSELMQGLTGELGTQMTY